MLKALSMLVIFVAAVVGPCLAASSKYQPATIVSVKPHPVTASPNSSSAGYDTTLRVGNTEYMVLDTPPSGTYDVQYTAGYELLVLIGSKTITFNDVLGIPRAPRFGVDEQWRRKVRPDVCFGLRFGVV